MAEYIQIGKIVATHGVAGEVLIVHSLGSKNTFKGVKVLFIEEVKNAYIPHFLTSAAAKNAEQTIAKLEGTDSKESAHRFIGKKVWLPEADFNRIADKNAPISLLGYKVFEGKEYLGIAEEVIEQPHQLLLKINYKEKEALIPVHAETLRGINRQSKEINVALPEGLLAIYLEK